MYRISFCVCLPIALTIFCLIHDDARQSTATKEADSLQLSINDQLKRMREALDDDDFRGAAAIAKDRWKHMARQDDHDLVSPFLARVLATELELLSTSPAEYESILEELKSVYKVANKGAKLATVHP